MFVRRATPALVRRAVFQPTIRRSFAITTRRRTSLMTSGPTPKQQEQQANTFTEQSPPAHVDQGKLVTPLSGMASVDEKVVEVW